MSAFESTIISTSPIKLNKSARSNLIIMIGHILAKQNLRQVSIIKNALRTELIRTKTTKKGTEVAIYKYFNANIIRAIHSILSSSHKVHSLIIEKIEQRLEQYKNILAGHPKRRLTPYMRFSVEFGTTEEAKYVRIMERSIRVRHLWCAMSDEAKAAYSVSDAEREKYNSDAKQWKSMIIDCKKCTDYTPVELPVVCLEQNPEPIPTEDTLAKKTRKAKPATHAVTEEGIVEESQPTRTKKTPEPEQDVLEQVVVDRSQLQKKTRSKKVAPEPLVVL